MDQITGTAKSETRLGYNETRQHFETRDLDGDAEKIRMEAYKVVSKEDAKRRSRERLLSWLALAIMLLLLAWLFGWI
ncbi:hypothetical protein Rhsp01_20400 [Rhizobium sp. NBRC 114257]|uniref:Transmembrane protein n=1 Tax=Rhizobium dioscoreae TaxID=2653122 RepID=A0ABQ0Z1X9_9HYPH|nr:hypothetical protein RsS93_20360 [Rhizobium dioscoreae]GLU80864.1 hypothetical protein Rhsp01_20400 [Rhizobium sp. NBRC 114257]